MSDEWRRDAACRGEDPDWWFETDPRSPVRQKALRICEGCPVKRPCGDAALVEEADATFREFIGIRGGLTADARRTIVRSRRMLGHAS